MKYRSKNSSTPHSADPGSSSIPNPVRTCSGVQRCRGTCCKTSAAIYAHCRGHECIPAQGWRRSRAQALGLCPIWCGMDGPDASPDTPVRPLPRSALRRAPTAPTRAGGSDPGLVHPAPQAATAGTARRCRRCSPPPWWWPAAFVDSS